MRYPSRPSFSLNSGVAFFRGRGGGLRPPFVSPLIAIVTAYHNFPLKFFSPTRGPAYFLPSFPPPPFFAAFFRPLPFLFRLPRVSLRLRLPPSPPPPPQTKNHDPKRRNRARFFASLPAKKSDPRFFVSSPSCPPSPPASGFDFRHRIRRRSLISFVIRFCESNFV